ncbi:MAG: transcription termination/antitermination protein NusG [Acidimicrobiia bacterium]|nr:transcription termination/antitermination protein NusG [Acidimicrobiia bacterium]
MSEDLTMNMEEEATQEESSVDDGGILAMALRESGLLAPTESETEPAESETVPAESETEPAADGGTPEPTDVEPAGPAESEADEAVATEAIDDAAVISHAEDVGGDEEDNEEDDDEEVEAAAPPKPQNPYELPGDWYVIHSYSGYENKVKVNLQTRISTMHMDTAIFDVVIPMEDVVEIKGGKKVTVPKKVLPGYLLVRMYMDDDAWFTVRNTPGVTGFVGHGTKPSPLTRREVERFLGTPEEAGEETKAAPRFKPAWDVGESVRVVEGPFADFNGVIEDINLDQSKVRVLVNIFDRETPVELTFEQIVKI